MTGTEDGQVHVYLITGAPGDMEHLYNAVSYRIQRLKQQATAPAVSSTTHSPGEGDTMTAKRKTDAAEEVRLRPIWI